MSALFSVTLCSAVMGMEEQKKEEQTIRKSPRIAAINKRNAKSANKEQNKSGPSISRKRQKINEKGSLKIRRMDTAHLINQEDQTSHLKNLHIMTAKFATLGIEENTVQRKQSVGDFLRIKSSSDKDMNDFMSSHDCQQEGYTKNKQIESIEQLSVHDQYRRNEKTKNVTMMDVNITKPKSTSGTADHINTADEYDLVISDESEGEQTILNQTN